MSGCRPGDMAVVIQSGNLVEVLRVATPADVMEWEPNAWWCKSLGSPVETYGFGGLIFRASERAFRDSDLRPIRDQPGEDEVLRYAGLPKGVTA